MKKRAFTLIELLVTMVIIAVLASLLLPILNHSKQSAQGIQCLSNTRQLGIAWKNYIDDNKGFFPLNIQENDAFNPSLDWVGGVENFNPNNTDNTNILLLTEGLIGPYIVTQPKIFKCPGDNLLCVETGTSPRGYSTGGQYDRVRSVSMNAYIGTTDKINNNIGEGSDVDFYVYEKESDISHISTSQLWLLLDEDAYSINDGYFVFDGWRRQFLDVPAKYHNGATSFSFVDCHAEIHSWRDNFGTNDANWMLAHSSVLVR